MSGDMKSEQERLVRAIAENSMAAPFVFTPFHSRQKDKEIADLAWACNNCVILMWMTEKEVYTDSATNKLVLKEAIDHNLGQANWGVRQWRRHTPLVGANAWRSFFLKYSAGIRVIALSVVTCGEAIARSHVDVATDLGVSLCATVPYPVLRRLADHHGTAVDLVKFLVELRSVGELSESDAVAWVERYAADCFQKSGAEASWPGRRLDGRFALVAKNLLMMRGRPEGGLPIRPASDMTQLKNIFCDIGLADFWRIVAALDRGFSEAIAGVPYRDRRVYPNVLRLETYDCPVCIVPFGQDTAVSASMQKLVSFWKTEMQSGRMRNGPIITVALDLGWTALHKEPLKPRHWHIESLLGTDGRPSADDTAQPSGTDPIFGRWGFGLACPHCGKFVVPVDDPSQGGDDTNISGRGTMNLKCQNPACGRLIPCTASDLRRVNLPAGSAIDLDKANAFIRPFRGSLRSQP